MRAKEELIREVEDRNKFRAEVGLPLVSVPKEVEKIHKGELWQDFRDWCETYPLRAQVAEEVLQTIRKEIGDPTWVPRGVLSGGGWDTAIESRRGCAKSGEHRRVCLTPSAC